MVASAWGLVIASGVGEKFSAEADTAFLHLASRPVLSFSLAAFEACPDIAGVVVVAPKDRMDSIRGMVHVYGYHKVKKIVAGSTQRQASVQAGLAALDDEAGVVVVHDGSRPCVLPADLVETIKSARRYGSGVLATRHSESLRTTRKSSTVSKPVEAEALWQVHTPQAYKREVLEKALKTVVKKKKVVSGDAEALDLLGAEVRLVPTDHPQLRIAAPHDLMYAEVLLRR